MTDWETFIRERGKCCACDGSLATSLINMGQLDRLATWECPTSGNVRSSDRRPRAVAVVCDSCFDKLEDPETRDSVKIKFAIEWNSETQEIVYHKVEDLEELPPIKIDLDRDD